MDKSACCSSTLLEFSSQHPSLAVSSTCSCSLGDPTQPPHGHASMCTSTLHTCLRTCKNAYTGMCTILIHMKTGEKKDHSPSLGYLHQLFRSMQELWSSGSGMPQAVRVPQSDCTSSYPFLSFFLLAPVATKQKAGVSVLGTMSQVFSSNEREHGRFFTRSQGWEQ